jgi:hypothetical protein
MSHQPPNLPKYPVSQWIADRTNIQLPRFAPRLRSRAWMFAGSENGGSAANSAAAGPLTSMAKIHQPSVHERFIRLSYANVSEGRQPVAGGGERTIG